MKSVTQIDQFTHFWQVALHISIECGFLQSAIWHQLGSSHVFGQAIFASGIVQSANLHQCSSKHVIGHISLAVGSSQSTPLQKTGSSLSSINIKKVLLTQYINQLKGFRLVVNRINRIRNYVFDL